MKKVFALVLALMMLIAAFAGCAQKEQNENAGNGYGWVNAYFTSSPPTLNKHSSVTENNGELLSHLVTTLYRSFITEDGKGFEYLPELAESEPIQMDEEGYVFQIKLRKNVQWDNGDLMDADTVIYSWKQLFSPDLINTAASVVINNSYFDFVNAREYNEGEAEWEDVGIKKIDDYTIEITSNTIATPLMVMQFTSIQNLCMVYEPLYEEYMYEDGSGTEYGLSLDKFMGSGRFILKEWLPDSKFVLERNPNWIYADKIKIAGINYRVVPDSQTALELFLNGELDFVNIAQTLWADYEEDTRVHQYYNDSLMYMFLNIGNPSQNGLIANLNFRKALHHGMDRSQIAKTLSAEPVARYVRRSVVGDMSTGQTFVTMEGSNDYVPDVTTIYNPTLASEYLTKALEECQLTSCTFELMYPEENPIRRATYEMLQTQYNKSLNGKLTIKLCAVAPGMTLTLRRWDPDNPTSYEGTIGSLLPAATDPTAQFRPWISTYYPPRTLWVNEEFDALYARSVSVEAMKDNDLRIDLCQQMEKIMLDELVVIPVYEIADRVLFNQRIQLPVTEYNVSEGFGYPSYVSIVD